MSGCPALFPQSAVVAAALLPPPPPSPTTTSQPASQPTQPGTHQRTRKKKQGQRRSLDTRSAGRRYEGKVRHVGGDDIDSETVGGSVGLAGTADCRGPWLHPASNAALVSQTATRPGSTSLARAVESSKRSRAPQTRVVQKAAGLTRSRASKARTRGGGGEEEDGSGKRGCRSRKAGSCCQPPRLF